MQDLRDLNDLTIYRRRINYRTEAFTSTQMASGHSAKRSAPPSASAGRPMLSSLRTVSDVLAA